MSNIWLVVLFCFGLFGNVLAESYAFSESFNDGNYTSSYSWTEKNGDDYPGILNITDGAVKFKRSGAGGNGGSVGIIIDTNIEVDSNTTVKFDGKAISRSVGNGCGWKCGEFPVNIQLTLEDSEGSEFTLRYSLNYGDAIEDKDDATYKQRAISVNQNEWIRDISFKIQEIWPTAVKITSVYLFAAGWDFEGLMDNIRISSTSSCPSAEAGTVSSNLDIHMPSLNYKGVFGTQNIWVDLEYLGTNADGQHTWGLKDYGAN